ncbi:cytochrome c oxidase assembly protein [Opitutus terrae]|uniref:cytochrome c oxidase assembly protein n=1 Tax=Opitutus terrae TaxID=107709 RepID=UPI00192C6160|nr:cytochrome c oxidase assembly protein [Opitutus terrae]
MSTVSVQANFWWRTLEPVVLAHVGANAPAGPQNWGELARAWEWEPLLTAALLLTAWVYARGVRRLWAEAGRGRGLRRWEVASFWSGWVTVVVALASPLHPWGRVLFSAHMTQHELLMVAAAPLLVLGRPIVALLFALPKPEARQLSQVARVPWVKTSWRALTNPLVAWAVHAVALWIWHVPQFFQATLTSNFVHDLQHVSFFGSALLFWWALIHGGPGRRGFGVAVLYLFTTMLHTGLLGALITLAGTQIYPAYAVGGGRWSLTPLEDQQLGGLIMWVPAGLVYIVSALALIAGWMRSTEAEDPAPAGTALDASRSPEVF